MFQNGIEIKKQNKTKQNKRKEKEKGKLPPLGLGPAQLKSRPSSAFPSSPPSLPRGPISFLWPRRAPALPPLSSHRQPGPNCQSSPTLRRKRAGHGRERTEPDFSGFLAKTRKLSPYRVPSPAPHASFRSKRVREAPATTGVKKRIPPSLLHTRKDPR